MITTTETSTNNGSTAIGTACRIGAAVAVLISGLVHLQLYLDGYRDFPNQSLGRSFLLDVVASAVLAVALVWRRDVLVRLAGAGLLVGTLIAFALSRSDRGIFGFTERGLEPSPQAGLALAAEVIGLLLLAATFVPAVGAGTTLRLPVVAGAAGATALIVVISAALWAQEDDGSVTATPSTTVAPATTAPAPTTTAAAPTTTSPGATAGPTTTGAATTTTTTTTAAATTTAPAAAGPVTVSIQDFTFREQTIEIPVGTTVEWVNEDSFAHTVVAEDGSFLSEDLAPGDTFTFTFETAGEFAYICGIHPSMLGTVVVTA